MDQNLVVLAKDLERATSRDDVLNNIANVKTVLDPMLAGLDIKKKQARPPNTLDHFDPSLKTKLAFQVEELRHQAVLLQDLLVQVMEQFCVSSEEVERRQRACAE